MFRITKQFAFEAAHRLLSVPEGHPCSALHGHSYRVEVELAAAELDGRGFCGADYRDLDPLKRLLDEQYDHAAILERDDPILAATIGKSLVLGHPPTAERLAERIYYEARRIVPAVVACRVSETAKTWAEYRP